VIPRAQQPNRVTNQPAADDAHTESTTKRLHHTPHGKILFVRSKKVSLADMVLQFTRSEFVRSLFIRSAAIKQLEVEPWQRRHDQALQFVLQ